MSQSTITMNAAQSGTLYTNDLSAALGAVDTAHSGASAPTLNVAEGKMWFDTSASPTVLKVYANGGFRTMMSFNTTNVDLSGRNATFTGTVTADVVNATSDARLKSDFHDIEKPMEMINLMKGHYYTKGGRQEVGVIAQEIKGVLPEVVDDSGEFMAVAYGNLVAVLIEGMKAQDKRIAELEGKAFCTCE